MFSAKLNKLEIGSNKQTSVTTKTMIIGNNTNAFLSVAKHVAAVTLSGNGALKYSTTGNEFVDQFGKMGSYKVERSYSDIESDMSKLWVINPLLSVCFIFFLRIITRVVQLWAGNKTETVQRGAGLKHESIVRMIWLHVNYPDTFWKNIQLFIAIGSWRDIFEMLRYDLQYNDWKNKTLDWNKFGTLLQAGLENPNTVNLVKKYMPQIKARSKCTTIETQANTVIGKWLSSLLFGEKKYSLYRKMKTSGTAHQWQQLISKQLYDRLDFNTVHGRALSLMVSGKFITNHNLTAKYESWLATKPIARFTGYVHELFKKVDDLKKYQMDTINKQFAGLVETAKKNAKTGTSLIVVRDTSGSMSSPATGTKQSAGDIAKALALFFSEMLPSGYFANSWIEFNNDAKMHTWKGSTPIEKWKNDYSNYIGTTNFQSVISLFAFIKHNGVAESEFPTGILCISDGEFNPTDLGTTNVNRALNKLRDAGFSHEYIANFQIVLWNLRSYAYGNNAGNKFETYGNVSNVYYFSGYDGSIIAFLTGVEGQTSVPKNAEELFNAAMDQEVMSYIEI